jgi:hypothetical protein
VEVPAEGIAFASIALTILAVPLGPAWVIVPMAGVLI